MNEFVENAGRLHLDSASIGSMITNASSSSTVNTPTLLISECLVGLRLVDGSP